MNERIATAAEVEAQAQYIKGTFEWMRRNIGGNLLSGNENDWTCIVTMHAMIETGLSGALAKQFQSSELSPVIARLAMSNTTTGKIAFAKALKILEPETIRFVRKLSELRNLCVHERQRSSSTTLTVGCQCIRLQST